MSYKLYSDEEKRLQRKLIPLNIVVAVLALVAAVSLLVTPLLKINFGKLASAFPAGDSEATAQYAAVGEGIDAEIELAPMDMAKVLFAPADEKGMVFMDQLLLNNGLLEQITVSFVNVALVAATREVDTSKLGEIEVSVLNEAIDKLDGVKTKEELNTAVEDYLKTLEGQIDEPLTEDMKTAAKDHCNELYDKTVAATGGSFSVEEMICVNMSPEGGETYLSYADLAAGMLKGEVGSSEDGGSAIAQYGEMLNQIAAPYGYAFLFVVFHVLMWLILFLFAFIHIFKKNKRFTMWYVKLVSCWPCIIFGVAVFAFGQIAPAVASIAPYAGLAAAFSTMTWISGGCYLLLWALSIFWAFPIKHKIRKLRKNKA